MLIVNQDPAVIKEAERILYYTGERYRSVIDRQTPVTDLEGPFIGLRQETIEKINKHITQTEVNASIKHLLDRLKEPTRQRKRIKLIQTEEQERVNGEIWYYA